MHVSENGVTPAVAIFIEENDDQQDWLVFKMGAGYTIVKQTQCSNPMIITFSLQCGWESLFVAPTGSPFRECGYHYVDTTSSDPLPLDCISPYPTFYTMK